jgi:DNA-binding MarR family transcriptional regulator
MHLKDELHIGKSLDSGHEVALALLLTREYVNRLFEEQVFRPSGLTDQQYNLLRILKGGPDEGYLIKDLRCRMIYRFADVPRLVDRMVSLGLLSKAPCPLDRRGSRVRITAKGRDLEAALRDRHSALCSTLDGCLTPQDRGALLAQLEKLRDDFRDRLAARPDPDAKPARPGPKPGRRTVKQD